MIDRARHTTNRPVGHLTPSGTRLRLSGLIDSLTTRKMHGGYSLMGALRLDTPYQGLSRLEMRLPMGTSLLAGDSAVLEGVLLEAGSALLFDCATD